MQAHSWEPSLLSLAHEAIHSFTPARNEVSYEEESLDRAYEHANDVTASNSRSFHFASAFFPRRSGNLCGRCTPFVDRWMIWSMRQTRFV